MATDPERLLAVLTRSQQLGFLGPGELRDHIEHARAHAAAARPASGRHWCDLGSGGGIPGLVMAIDHDDIHMTLLDRSERRTEFLDDAVRRLDLAGRVHIAHGDAAELAHDREHRHRYDGVVSRAFGPPAAVAECSVGLLRLGGALVVSEPPAGAATRWPAAPLSRLGLRLMERSSGHSGTAPTFAVLERQAEADATYPRPWKKIRRRPLF